MDNQAALSKEFELNTQTDDPPRREGHRRRPHGEIAAPAASTKTRLATMLKARRRELGLTQHSLAQKLGIRASHIALLENGRRRPSLGLIVRLTGVLGFDGRELLETAYPEIRTLLSPASPRRRIKLNNSWERLFKNDTLLSRYRVTSREIEVLEHLGMLGGKLTAKRLLAILLLVRDTP